MIHSPHLAMTKILPFLLLLPCLLFCDRARAQFLENDALDEIVAVVDEEVILRSELDRSVKNILTQYAGRSAQLPPKDVLEKQVLERLINIRLQVQRALSTGIRISDSELDQAVMNLAQQNKFSIDQLRASLAKDGLSYDEFRKTMRDELAIQKMKQRFMQSRVMVTDTEIDIFLANGQLKAGEVRLSHILVPVADSASAQDLQNAKQKAEQVHKEIEEGLDFATAAIRYSAGQQALEGGDLGWRRYNEVPSVFSEVVANMHVGEVTPAMRGPSGFHILKLVDQRENAQDLVKEFHARHILVRTSELVSAAEAEKKIGDVARRIKRGEDFAELAKTFSDDTTSANLGGDMGWFELMAYGTVVGQKLDSLKDDEISEPFTTDAGWHVMQRLGTREQDRTQEKNRTEAGNVIRNRKAEEEYDLFMRELRAEAYIENRLDVPMANSAQKAENAASGS